MTITVIGGRITDYSQMIDELVEHEGISRWKTYYYTGVNVTKIHNRPYLDIRLSTLRKVFNSFGFEVYFGITKKDGKNIIFFTEAEKIHNVFCMLFDEWNHNTAEKLSVSVGCCPETIEKFKSGKGNRAMRFIYNVFRTIGYDVYLFAVEGGENS